jgi:hypothetical protein
MTVLSYHHFLQRDTNPRRQQPESIKLVRCRQIFEAPHRGPCSVSPCCRMEFWRVFLCLSETGAPL